MIRWTVGAILLLSLSSLGFHRTALPGHNEADNAMETIQGPEIRAHMRFLSDGLLEGRAPGTNGYAIAAQYVATELEGMGLEPGGTNGSWFQMVAARKAVPDLSNSQMTLIDNGTTHLLKSGVDYVPFGNASRRESTTEADLLFVGFGVSAPEMNYDDYIRADAKGKIVVEMEGAPSKFPPTQRAFYSEQTIKAQNAAAHGAVGIIFIRSHRGDQAFPWQKIVAEIALGDMEWLGLNHEPQDSLAGLGFALVTSQAGTELLFAKAPESLEQVYKSAQSGEPQSFPLQLRASVHVACTHSTIESPNIIGKFTGSDPVLREQYVVYTTHVDHLGICPEVAGDNVCHGAWDNASGDASLIEIARAFTRLEHPTRRSVLFLFTTGEEIGFLGSGYFAHFPTVPKNSIVADINIDGAPGLLGSREDMVNFCAGHSSLDRDFEEAAKEVGYRTSPDPMPEETLFIRSDQYSFITQGIPAIFINDGVTASDPKIAGLAVFKKYLALQYHTPLDNMSQPFDYDSAAKGSRLNFLLGYRVAEQAQPPSWNERDFFGLKFAQGHRESTAPGR